MAWSPQLTALNQLLANYYPELESARRVVDRAGIPGVHIAFSSRAIDNWYAILLEAERRAMVRSLIDAALTDYPRDPLLRQARDGLLEPEAPRRQDLGQTAAPSRSEYFHAEALMSAQSTLLPISFLASGLRIARSVALIKTPIGPGTGFLIEDNLLVTNNHVLPTPVDAGKAKAMFGYEADTEGNELSSETLALQPDRLFITSPESRHDWTIVAVDGNPNATYGAIELRRIDLASLIYVNIIQHPLGGHKHVALYHNTVVRHDDESLYYLTDTHEGSSGAPVFDSAWRVVALHRGHMTTFDYRQGSRVFSNVGTNINLVIDRVI